MRNRWVWIGAAAVFAAGVWVGGLVFSQSQPRSFLAFHDCRSRCLNANELAGLVASVGLLRTPGWVPGVVLESDTCVSVRHPQPIARVHYVLFPKHDTRNLATLTPQDTPALLGCLAMLRELVQRERLTDWRVHSNGPGYQEIAYLHLHLVAE